MSAPNNTRRKLALSTWEPPREGNIYGKLTIDASKLVPFLTRFRETTGEKLTVTHLVGKAVALALAKAPGLNGRILFGKYIPHETVDVTYLVSLEDGADLSKVKVPQTDQKSLVEIAQLLRARAEKLRQGKDEDFEKTKGAVRLLPVFLLKPLVWFTGFLGGSLGISVPFLGVERFPFGSCIITSVGMLGIDEAFAPHTPFARVPVLILVGAVKDSVVAVEGKMEIRPQLTVTATVDHRFVDGTQLGILAKLLRELLENPERMMQG
ncbi:MAG: 2-oxo acid dehydrogenase subunit E2 [Myxococcota bacterium]